MYGTKGQIDFRKFLKRITAHIVHTVEM